MKSPLFALVGLCLVGCNSSNAPSPLSPTTVAEMQLQNRSGCLDLGLLNKRIQSAKTTRTAVVDMKYAKAPSEAMLYNLADSLKDRDESDVSSVSQDGCSSLTFTDPSKGDIEAKIIEHTKKLLRFQIEVTDPATGSAAETTHPADFIVELVSESRIRVTQVMPTAMEHNCSGKSVEESVQQVEVDETDFGDTLPPRPADSRDLTLIRAKTTVAQLKAKGDPTVLETEFCSTEH